MIIDDKIRDQKLQYDINREVVKISASSSGKINKYEYLTSEEITPSNQRQIIELSLHIFLQEKLLKNKPKQLKIKKKSK